MKHEKIRCLCEGAVLLALAELLGFLKLWEMPWGGSIVLSMIPMVVYAIRWGLLPGLCAGALFGFLQFLTDGGFAIGWQSLLGDYLLAFSLLGLAALGQSNRHPWLTGSLLAGAARFLAHYVTGATVWAEYMPEVFFGLPMTSPWFYSALYNLAFMAPNTILTAVVLGLAPKPLKHLITPCLPGSKNRKI